MFWANNLDPEAAELVAALPGRTGYLHFAVSDRFRAARGLPSYLRKGLTGGASTTILRHHYATLLDALTEQGFFELTLSDAVLWRSPDKSAWVSVRRETTDFDEGEMTLSFFAAGRRLYRLSATFLPGHFVGKGMATVALISRLQGERDCLQEFKDATRAAGGVSPPFVLLAALEGMAEPLNVLHVFGCRGEDQVKLRAASLDRLRHTYDDFFESAGGTATEDGLVYLDPLHHRRPLHEIERSHRRRAKRRRAARSVIRHSARTYVTALLR